MAACAEGASVSRETAGKLFFRDDGQQEAAYNL
jgi:hypothetical protein